MLYLLAVICGLATSVIFFRNQTHRDAIDMAMNPEGAKSKKLVQPEKLPSYNVYDLTTFRDRAAVVRTSYGDTALDHYTMHILKWNDILFAVAMAAFAATCNVALAAGSSHPFLQGLLLVSAFVGLAYGVVDILEDRTLARLLNTSGAIDGNDASRAQRLTRLKIGLLIVSLSGLALWFALGGVHWLYKRLS